MKMQSSVKNHVSTAVKLAELPRRKPLSLTNEVCADMEIMVMSKG